MTIEESLPTGTEDGVGQVAFRLNGAEVAVRADHPHLLAALREELDVTSVKDGCSPSGQCGCCTVMIDGKVQISCTYATAKVAGREVITLDGIGEQERTTWSNAFAACGGLQCGFCIPGIVMRAKAQVDKKGADLTREDMSRHLGAHLCRCTGYVKVLDAIEAVALGKDLRPAANGGIGSSGAKYEAAELTLGDRGYVDDIRVPGMLHAALVFTEHARAEITSIDPAGALAAAGVVAVYTADDIPGELRVGIIHQDWPVMIPVGGRTSYLGDVTRHRRRRDPPTSPGGRPNWSRSATRSTDRSPTRQRRSRTPRSPCGGRTTTSCQRLRRTPAATSRQHWRRAPTWSSERFQTQRIEHAFLEPESTLAVVRDDGGLHVYSGGQGVWDDRNQIASTLGLGHDRVSVELVSNGGAFGGKEDMSNQAHAALAAWLLQRPVKCTLSREESLPDARQAASDPARLHRSDATPRASSPPCGCG